MTYTRKEKLAKTYLSQLSFQLQALDKLYGKSKCYHESFVKQF